MIREFFTKELVFFFKWPIRVWNILLIGLIMAGIMTPMAYRPTYNSMCGAMTREWSGGRVNFCRALNAIGGGLVNGLATISPATEEGGTGGSILDAAAQQETIPSNALVLGGTQSHTHDLGVEPSTILAIEEIEGGITIDITNFTDPVAGGPIKIYRRPARDASFENTEWSTSNTQVVAHAVLLNGAEELWIRITEPNHGTPWYMYGDYVDTSALPIVQLPPPPVMLPSNPWGELAYEGDPEESMVEALTLWEARRSQGIFRIDQALIDNLNTLSAINDEWLGFYNSVLSATQTQMSVRETILTSTNANIEQSMLASMDTLATQTMRWVVTEIEDPGMVDGGTHNVTLEMQVMLNGAYYPVGDPIKVQIWVLRFTMALDSIAVGQPLVKGES